MDVATVHTFQFVIEAVGPSPARLLEIGCGKGRLARTLMDRGYEVSAVDEDPELVAFARDLGVDARQGAWPNMDLEGPFDAVLFTRSLHHLSDLKGSIERSRDLLSSEGRLLVEDFDWKGARPTLIEWFVEQLRELAGRDFIETEDEFPWTLLGTDNAIEVWQSDHRSRLQSATAIHEQISLSLSIRRHESTPYLFRYVGDSIDDPCERRNRQEKLLNGERFFCMAREIPMLGRRWVAQRA